MAKSFQTRGSSLEEHSQTKVYYYSKFDLFGQDPQFQQFATFRQRLSAELGADWAAEAGLLYDPFLSGKQVFLHLLELWLRHPPPVNTMRSTQKASTFNSQFVTDFDSLMRGPSGRIPLGVNVKPAASSLRAVCLGFYMTANQLWEQLFQGQSSNKQSSPLPGGFLKGVTNTLEKTFQPLMVVTQQITSVFGRKRRKLNEAKQDAKDDQSDGEMRLEDCYPCFRKALDMEKQLERKMGDFGLEDLQVQSEQREVHKSSFLQQQSPLQPSLVSHLYSYVTGFLNRNPSWQVASNFVTQILDLNQAQLSQGEKVKVLRPAQDFYRKLVIVWLLCHQDRSSVGFQDYLAALRSCFFAEGWEARFVPPTKYFFEKMRGSWEGDREKLSGFISKVQGCVGKDWNAKIATRGC